MYNLGELPSAGAATVRQKMTTDAIMFFMRGVERERSVLLSIVLDGIDKWRRVSMAKWRGLDIDRDLVDSVWRYFALQAMPPRFQYRVLQHPNKFYEILHKAMPYIEAQAVQLDRLQKPH